MRKTLYFIAISAAFVLRSYTMLAQTVYITTVVGNGSAGYSGDGGPATAASLSSPTGVVEDLNGNLYVCDNGNNRIRKVNSVTHVISTVAGNGTAGYSGDGGPATAAALRAPNAVAIDGYGNLYVADEGNHVIRKINTAGIISTVVGTGSSGDSGDGGAASAATLESPTGIAVDGYGNIYISDHGPERIRKVNTSGVITTIGGGGSGDYSADGVPATSISLCGQNTVSVDQVGNVYITNYACARFLRISASGLIYDVAGDGDPSFSGDGGLATAAGIENPYGICADLNGNVYLCPRGNERVRKIDATTGIITTLGGTGTAGYSGDGGPATDAEVSSIYGVYADILGNVFFADEGNERIRMITPSYFAYYTCDSFSVFVNEYCNGPQITVACTRYNPAFTVNTNFGDGTSGTYSVSPGFGGTPCYAMFNHNYPMPGTYTLKTILYDGAVALDSLVYTYEYRQCVTIPIKFFWDTNGNCVKDSGEQFNTNPLLIKVDSNGVTIDTITATSGVYYNAYGAPGDVYSFSVITDVTGIAISCPVSGIISDTIVSGIYNLSMNYVPLECPASGFDLAVTDVIPVTGEHDEWGNIYVSNNACTPIDATVTLNYSKDYNVYDGHGLDVRPAPASYTDSSITWNIAGVNNSERPVDLYYAIWTDDACCGYLSPGMPVNSYVTVTPTAGDLDPANNSCVIIDTVKAGCDPNEMSVSPSGCLSFSSGEIPLQYAINFTNVGNDTAFNIYVMDTLPNTLDIKSMRLTMASNTMNIFTFNDGANNIVKFDFPGINLQDSTACPQCAGAVVFTINTIPGLPLGTNIANHAGVFFDYNPVVLTNTVLTTVGNCPTAVANIEKPVEAAIYPNPTHDAITIKTDAGAYSSYTITNAIGTMVLQGSVTAAQTQVDMTALADGVYIVMLKGDNGIVVRKVVKE